MICTGGSDALLSQGAAPGLTDRPLTGFRGATNATGCPSGQVKRQGTPAPPHGKERAAYHRPTMVTLSGSGKRNGARPELGARIQ